MDEISAIFFNLGFLPILCRIDLRQDRILRPTAMSSWKNKYRAWLRGAIPQAVNRVVISRAVVRAIVSLSWLISSGRSYQKLTFGFSLICCWFSPSVRDVFVRVLRFPLRHKYKQALGYPQFQFRKLNWTKWWNLSHQMLQPDLMKFNISNLFKINSSSDYSNPKTNKPKKPTFSATCLPWKFLKGWFHAGMHAFIIHT